MVNNSESFMPNIPKFELRPFNPYLPENEEDAEKVIRWSVRESMIAISRSSIKVHHFALGAYAELEPGNPTLIGYAAITQIYSKKVMELGGLVVSQKVRRLGVGSSIVRAVVDNTRESMDPDMIIAFSNQSSAKTFLKLGGTRVEDATTLPNEVWKQCHTCRSYDEVIEKGEKCCGRCFDITHVTELSE